MRRHLRTVERRGADAFVVHGQAFINLSSNDYLGLAQHPTVVAAAQQALAYWGAGASSSQLVSGHTALHDELEKALADWLGRESALVFPSGYMANLAAVTALVGPGDAVIADRLCHASIIDAIRLSGARLFVFAHRDAGQAERALKRAAGYRRRLLVTESLFSMDGDAAPLEALSGLTARYDAMMLVDDAHALGVCGPDGRGLALGQADLVVGTLSKALGSQGGFVAGPAAVRELLINRARAFIYTTGLAPAAAGAALAAIGLLRKNSAPRETLRQLAMQLRDGLREQDWNLLASESQIIPVLLGSPEQALRVAEGLERNGIFAPAIRPPTVSAGECRLRFSVSATLSRPRIDQVIYAMKGLRYE
jgi:8-amino-7-oxononanoate synthase